MAGRSTLVPSMFPELKDCLRLLFLTRKMNEDDDSKDSALGRKCQEPRNERCHQQETRKTAVLAYLRFSR